MAQLRSNGPYIWVTWLTKLLVGEHSCEWAAWFKSQHSSWSWEKLPSNFDAVQWQLAHTARLNANREQLEQDGYKVFTEGQNSFALRGKTATMGGKPDLIARKDGGGTIIDIKTGKPDRASHSVQVMLYMYAVPRSLSQHKGITFDGKVVYNDHEIVIPASAVDEAFIGNMAQLIQRLGASTPARLVPSASECGYCDISSDDCPARAAGGEDSEGETVDF